MFAESARSKAAVAAPAAVVGVALPLRVAHTAVPPSAVAVLAAPFVHVWPAVHSAASAPPGHLHAALFAFPLVFAHAANIVLAEQAAL